MITKNKVQIIFFAAILALIGAPFFSKGYLFLLDMVFTPSLGSGFLKESGPTALFHYLIYLLNTVFDASLIQKSLLLFALAAAPYCMSMLARRLAISSMVAASIYMLNPWVYERFLAGHWYVLFGYAIFPLFVLFSMDFFGGTVKDKVKWAVLFCLYPLISIHWFYIASLVFIALAAFNRKKLGQVDAKIFPAVLMLFMLINGFWIFGGFFSDSSTYGAISRSDFDAFPTKGDPTWGIYFNVLSLYGFWGTDYVLPKEVTSFWWVVTFYYLLFSFVGWHALKKHSPHLAYTVLVGFVACFLLGVGVSSPATSILVDLAVHLPGFNGLRETSKLIGFLAFSYGLLVPLGLKYFVEKIFEKDKKYVRWGMSGAAIFLAIFSVSTEFNGFMGQVRPHPYPDSWFRAENVLNEQNAKSLVLPWWGYVRLPFADNRLIANPANRFFSSDVIVSERFENMPSESADDMGTRIDGWVGKQDLEDGDYQYLKSQGIGSITLLEEEDSPKFEFLNREPELEALLKEGEISVYKIK